MKFCINKNLPEFKSLVNETALDENIVAAKASVYFENLFQSIERKYSEQMEQAETFENTQQIRESIEKEKQFAIETKFPKVADIISIPESNKEMVDVLANMHNSRKNKNYLQYREDFEESIYNEDFEMPYEEDLDDQNYRSRNNQKRISFMQKHAKDFQVQTNSELDVAVKFHDINSKKGKENGSVVYEINPSLFFEIEETNSYFRLFIEGLGGKDNPVIEAFMNNFRETDFYKKEALKYNEELIGDYEIEILRKLFTENPKIEGESAQEKVNKFKERIVKLASRKLGLTEDAFNDYISDVLGSVQDEQIKRPKKSYSKKNKFESLIDLNKSIKEKVNAKLKIYQSKNKSEYVKKIKEIKEELDEASGKSEEIKALTFIQFVNENFEFAANKKFKNEYSEERFQNILNDAFLSENEHIRKVAKRELAKAKNYLYAVDAQLSSMDIITDFQSFLKINPDSKALVDKALGSDSLKMISNIIANKNSIQKTKIELSREMLAYELGSRSNINEAAQRDFLEKEWNKKNKTGLSKLTEDQKESRETYINERLIANKGQNVINNINLMREKLRIDTDLTVLSSWLVSPDNLNSSTIQLVKKILDEKDFEANAATMQTHSRLYDLYEKIKNLVPTGDPSRKWDNFIDKDSEGNPNGYLIDEYKTEFKIEYDKEIDLRNSAEQKLIEENPELSADFIKSRRLFAEANEEKNVAKKENLKKQASKFYSDLKRKLKNNYAEYREASDRYDAWKSENTIKVEKENGMFSTKPAEKWKNKKYESLSTLEKEVLKSLKEIIKEDDKKLPFQAKLTSKAYDSTYFTELPSINRTALERLYNSEGVLDYMKHWYDDAFSVRKDDTELMGSRQEMDESSDINMSALKKVIGNEKGELRHGVPIHYRGKKDKDQSYDIFTLIALNNQMSNNYEQKSLAQKDIELLLDIYEDIDHGKKTFAKDGGDYLLSSLTNKYIEQNAIAGNEYKVLKSMIEHRLYGIGSMSSDKSNKMAGVVMKWTAQTVFALNYFAGFANLLQGKTQNAIEGLSGISKINLVKGESRYWKDADSWKNDIGSMTNKSMTNQLLGKLQILDSFKGVHSKFINDNRFKALLGGGAAYFMSNAGEHNIHGTLMWGILEKIKAKNANNQLIDKEGKVVSKEEESASIADMYEMVNGVPKISPLVKMSTLNNKMFSEVELSNYIKHIASQLHGQYDSQLKAMAQRHWAGSMGYMFRKWLVPGVLRRFRGTNMELITEAWKKSPDDYKDTHIDSRFFSEDTQRFEEGYYTTMIKMLGAFKNVKKASLVWENMTEYERKNIHKTFIDAMIMAGAFVSYAVLKGLAKGEGSDDDDNEFLLFGAFLARRLYTEQRFYTSPSEFWKLMKSPAASVSYLENMYKLTGQVLGVGYDDGLYLKATEVYKAGNYKGENKAWRKIKKTTPYVSQYMRNIDEALGYLE